LGKRSDFKRRPHDSYDTPPAAVQPLLPFLRGTKTFAEPCVGHGYLLCALKEAGLECTYAGDIRTGQDALFLSAEEVAGADAIITNPPWTRELMHPLLDRFMRLAPTWLLFDADWSHNQHAGPWLRHCSHIVSVGRVRWIEGSKYDGKDNAAWYRFHSLHVGPGPVFYGHGQEEAA
jgi:methylase of polypeptide subunit release factors